MELPLYLSGRPAGTLQVRRQGLYTLFTAQLPPRPGLTRLYLHGGGESRLLGLMEPAAGMLRLRRKLSRAAQPPNRASISSLQFCSCAITAGSSSPRR